MNGERLTNVDEDIAVSFLKSQIRVLENIIDGIEKRSYANDFANENLKRVEKNLRWIRKLFFTSNM